MKRLWCILFTSAFSLSLTFLVEETRELLNDFINVSPEIRGSHLLCLMQFSMQGSSLAGQMKIPFCLLEVHNVS